MKYKPQRSDIKTRENLPKVVQTKKGVEIQCPFCIPPHALLPGVESPCGTTLKVTAVQMYLTSHATRHNSLRCLKCGQVGGEMTRYRNGYVHMNDCMPGTKLLTEIPKLNKTAAVVYRMPPKIRKVLEKKTGVAKQLQEIDAEGNQTGKVLGYFFWKG